MGNIGRDSHHIPRAESLHFLTQKKKNLSFHDFYLCYLRIFAFEKFQNPWPKLGLVDQHENNRQG